METEDAQHCEYGLGSILLFAYSSYSTPEKVEQYLAISVFGTLNRLYDEVYSPLGQHNTMQSNVKKQKSKNIYLTAVTTRVLNMTLVIQLYLYHN